MINSRNYRVSLLTVFCLMHGTTALAVDNGSEAEISHLLEYIDTSDCRFIRNGTEYDAQEARQHIEKKYDYIKSRLSTTDGFIRYAATESSFTGRPYEVICNGDRQTSASWLQTELARYRQRP
jgi:hypothetical protein